LERSLVLEPYWVVVLLLLHCFFMHYGGSGKLDKMHRAYREKSTQAIEPAVLRN